MRRIGVAAASIAVMALFSIAPAFAQSRVALVIANSAYQGAPPVATAAADADLIATALQTAGFDVTPAADLSTQTLGATIGSFLDKVTAAGPDGIVFVYFSGYAAQANSDDYLVPVDAQIDTAASVPDVTLALSALTKALGDVPSAARILVLDAARDGGFGKAGGQPVPPGLALTVAPPGFLLAYSAAPDTYAPEVSGANSPYAAALATLMGQPGLDIEQIFKGVRVQVNQATTGLQTPWTSSALTGDVKLVAAPAAAAAPPKTLAPALGVSGIAVPPPKRRRITKTAMRRMSADEAYRLAIEEDSLRDYQWFVETHPEYSLAGQVWDIIGNRREGILWRRTLKLGSTRAYWNYLNRYPNGAHAYLARSWLDARGEPLPSGYIAQPLPLPPGYYDEAIGLPDLVPLGFARPADVFFGSPGSEFAPAPRGGLNINVNNFNFGKGGRDRNQAGPPPNQQTPQTPTTSPTSTTTPTTTPTTTTPTASTTPTTTTPMASTTPTTMPTTTTPTASTTPTSPSPTPGGSPNLKNMTDEQLLDAAVQQLHGAKGLKPMSDKQLKEVLRKGLNLPRVPGDPIFVQ